jgi:uncharacterized membrane protein
METRPKIKPEQTTADRLIEVAGWLALALLWTITLFYFRKLPGTVPTHFNAAGNADGFGTRSTVFLLPSLGTLLFIGLSVLKNFPYVFNYPVKITPENALKQYTMAVRLIRVLKFCIILIFTMLTWMSCTAAINRTNSLGAWFLPVTLMIMFVPLGIYIAKSFRNK